MPEAYRAIHEPTGACFGITVADGDDPRYLVTTLGEWIINGLRIEPCTIEEARMSFNPANGIQWPDVKWRIDVFIDRGQGIEHHSEVVEHPTFDDDCAALLREKR